MANIDFSSISGDNYYYYIINYLTEKEKFKIHNLF